MRVLVAGTTALSFPECGCPHSKNNRRKDERRIRLKPSVIKVFRAVHGFNP
jgi:hypothetical protein